MNDPTTYISFLTRLEGFAAAADLDDQSPIPNLCPFNPYRPDELEKSLFDEGVSAFHWLKNQSEVCE